MKEEYECLKLENQLCFPLYVCSKEIIKKYKPFLDKIDLTYTQYITMMVLWDKKELNVKSLGNMIFLDSGTLTPVLKKLESKGYIERHRDLNDERNLIIKITKLGIDLRKKAKDIQENIKSCISITSDDAKKLYEILYKILGNIEVEGL